MISVAEAEHIILQQVADYGTEVVDFRAAMGRVLADDLVADRDMPACDRATMDGIAISFEAFEKGSRQFNIAATQAAGDAPVELPNAAMCIEIMTGGALTGLADTVIRYEDLLLEDGIATVQTQNIRKGQNIHKKGRDRKANDMIVPANTLITPAIISAAAFTGRQKIEVKKMPKVMIFSNGDELANVDETPPVYKIRRSNGYMLQAALAQLGLSAGIVHLPDDESIIETEVKSALAECDVLILSGGVSMGKYDLVAKTLERLAVKQLFHKVQQRPGKPFWFGLHGEGARVFAFPGNPVSTFMCFHRYFVPWYKKSMGLNSERLLAVLGDDVSFEPKLQYFLQVKLNMNEAAQVVATPFQGNGSGDLANLVDADAFMELPAELNNFKKGEVYPIWPFKPLFI